MLCGTPLTAWTQPHERLLACAATATFRLLSFVVDIGKQSCKLRKSCLREIFLHPCHLQLLFQSGVLFLELGVLFLELLNLGLKICLILVDNTIEFVTSCLGRDEEC